MMLNVDLDQTFYYKVHLNTLSKYDAFKNKFHLFPFNKWLIVTATGNYLLIATLPSFEIETSFSWAHASQIAYYISQPPLWLGIAL